VSFEAALMLAMFAAAVVTVIVFARRAARLEAGVRADAAPRELSSLYEIAARAHERFQASASPADVLRDDVFLDGVRLFEQGDYSQTELLGYLTGDNVIIACMAMEALARAPGGDDVVEPILAGINDVAPWTRYFALRALSARVPQGQPLLGKTLARIDRSWLYPTSTRLLRDFVCERIAGGEVPSLGEELDACERTDRTSDDGTEGPGGQTRPVSHGQWLLDFLPRLGDKVRPLLQEVRDWSAGRIDVQAALPDGLRPDATRTAGQRRDTTARPRLDHASHNARIGTDRVGRHPARSVEPGTAVHGNQVDSGQPAGTSVDHTSQAARGRDRRADRHPTGRSDRHVGGGFRAAGEHPVPVGPASRNTPCGRVGSVTPALIIATRSTRQSTASVWPITRDSNSSRKRERFRFCRSSRARRRSARYLRSSCSARRIG